MVAKRGSRVGAAVFVLGLSIAAPHAVATADGQGDDSAAGAPAGSAGPAANPAPARGGRVAPKAARSGTRGAPASTPAISPDTAPRAASSRNAPESTSRPAPSAQPDANSAGPQPLPSAAVVKAPKSAKAQEQEQAASNRLSAPNSDVNGDSEPSAVPTPASAITVATPAPAAASAPSAAATAGAPGCPACWGAQAPNFGQAITTVVNHLFNSTFDWLSTLPANPFSNLLEGALVLVRRSLFLIPTGVTATQAGTELTVKVNTGSVAYVRQDGNFVEVSGLPSFARADQFDSATLADVSVSNPGNAGCAGFVLESGVVATSLTTNQIDSLRFGSGAAFADSVTATVTGGPLTLQDAVRSQTNVTFNAPVVLKNTVEVDAGNGVDAGSGDVMFSGTVDAVNTGKQSLSVTALGTTTFAAPVGGQAPLASLLTRGVAPLAINQSADTKTIPLHFAPDVSDTGKVQIKYGIDVAIGDNASQLYEFDTGGNAFFAGYNPSFWKNVPLTTVADSVSFTSGNTFDFVVSDTSVTLGSGAQTVSTGQPIQVGAILTGGNDKKDPPETFVFTNPDAPPVDGNFFGDFGASFGVFDLHQPGQQLLASPLLQLPGNLSTGFLVQLGPIGTTDPQLTVGITDALRDQFPFAVPVTVATPPQTYPVSGYQVLNLFGMEPTYFAQKGTDPRVPIGCETANPCPNIPTLIDSGAPSTSLRVTEGTPYAVTIGKKQFLEPGVTLIAEFQPAQGREPFTWNLVAGDTASVNSVGYGGDSVATTGENVNTGLNLYNTYDVMFDVQNQVIWLRPNDGAATVVAGSVTTTGDQTYRQNAKLGGTYTTGGGEFTVGGGTELTADTAVNAGSGDVSFFGTVEGDPASSAHEGRSLTVNSTGATVFTRGVGQLAPLGSLTTDSGGTTATAGVTTTGNQSFGDDATLSGAYVSKGSFSVAGDTSLASDVDVAADAADQSITFDGRIEGAPGRGFRLRLSTSGGTVELKGDVGATNPLGGLTVDNRGDKQSPAGLTADGSIALSGGVGSADNKGLSIGGSGPVVLNLTNGGVIQGFTDSGIVIGKDSSGTVSEFVISNNGGDGIQANDTKNLTLSDNVLFGNKVGIEIKSSDDTDAKNTVRGNTIGNNHDSGIVVDTSAGNEIQSNSIYGNGAKTKDGIVLKSGNGDQLAPTKVMAVQSQPGALTVSGRIADTGYQGAYTIQIFLTPSNNATLEQAQGRQLIATETGVPAGDFSFAVGSGTQNLANDFITVTATPSTGPTNTSPFSDAAQVTT